MTMLRPRSPPQRGGTVRGKERNPFLSCKSREVGTGVKEYAPKGGLMMRKFIVSNIFSAVIGLFSLLFPPVVYAQDSVQPLLIGQSSFLQSQPQQDVSDNERQAFAKVHVAVEEIRASQAAFLSQVQKLEQAQKIQQGANVKMVKAVKRQS
jgi:hypothetical protein